MDRELEELIKAYDAVREARSRVDHQRLLALYDARLDDVLQRRPPKFHSETKARREALQKAIRVAHRKWVAAQQKPSTLPPTA